jgi:hypothetical protein
VLQPPENGQVIAGLVPEVAPNKVVALVTLLSKTFLVILFTCTVQPVLKLVPCKPLLPLVQVSAGVAGLLAALQVDAITALLVRHIVSPVASAFAVMISPFTRVILFNAQAAPLVMFEAVPIDEPFL